jgi:hypothetical protein
MNDGIRASILKLTAEEVEVFFLDGEKYFTTKLPHYFEFNVLLKSLSDYYDNNKYDYRGLKKLISGAANYSDVNYGLITNKDGHYAWRKVEIIHPFLYICLIKLLIKNWQELRELFKKFNNLKENKIISPCIPVQETKGKYVKQTILNWWKEVEQEAIVLSLKYSYVINVDIANCYSSMYTHSIAWAIHGKEKAKENRSEDILGNNIDFLLRSMSSGQTNGIPQGSVLMDFIAEILLGYIDTILVSKLKNKVENYEIIRYRDDYKIFTNNSNNGEEIVKCLSEVLIEFGMKLNSQKTSFEDSIVNGAIKKDKLYLILSPNNEKNPQKQLITIYNFGRRYPNSGQLVKLLSTYNKNHYFRKLSNDLERRVLMSIAVNIAYENPRVYPICTSIISRLLSNQSKEEVKKTIEQIRCKFSNKINNDYLDIWMQRLSYKTNHNTEYSCKLCKLVTENTNVIWNSDWLPEEIQKIIDKTPIINKNTLEKMPPTIKSSEVDDFYMSGY